MSAVSSHRLYIDESGDHTYRHLHDANRRYLGLTGVLIRKDLYNPDIPVALESLKKRLFTYDPDMPPILTRKQIIDRKSWFGVLQNPATNEDWENQLIAFYSDLPAQIFTVVIDKKVHLERYPTDAWNPYSYGLAVLLWRVRGYLQIYDMTADVMPESRGDVENNQLLAAYVELRTQGARYGDAEDYRRAFVEERLLFRRKDQNIAGLQLADLIAAEQKLLTITESGRPMPRAIGPFGQRLNKAIAGKVNQYGRYMLE